MLCVSLNCLSAVEAIGRGTRALWPSSSPSPCLNCLSAVEAIGSVRRRPQAVGELRGVSIAFRLLKRLVVEAMKQTKDYPRWSQLPFGC